MLGRPLTTWHPMRLLLKLALYIGDELVYPVSSDKNRGGRRVDAVPQLVGLLAP